MKNIPRDLGVYTVNDSVYLFSHALSGGNDILHLGVSNNGLNFKASAKAPALFQNESQKEDTRFCTDFRISKISGLMMLLYKFNLGKHSQLCLASSKDGLTWKKISQPEHFTQAGMLAPEYSYENKHVMYYGEGNIYISYSEDLKTWITPDKPLLAPRPRHFDNQPLSVMSVINTQKGLLVIYAVRKRQREGDNFSVGAALFDKKNPQHLLWRSEKPVWEQKEHWKNGQVYPMGAVYFKDNLFLYFGIEGDAVYAVSLGKLENIYLHDKKGSKTPKLAKHPHNPIIAPVLKHHWEANATFNTAALYEGGKVHFVYRAMGPHNTSVLGYASSQDGIHIDERLSEPIYYPTEPFEVPATYPSINYMSGGGYGGCEDPRLTKIDDMIYMTYVAYNGKDAPKVALTSIKLKDFLAKKWIWAKPKIISSPRVVNKNCVIFPEKINGKYAVMHRVFPRILIDFVDDLNFDNSYLTGHYSIHPREDSWDSRKLGAGAPPIKTKDGWLLIYQAVDDKDPGKYKIGAMLLDLKDPSKVICRPHQPILEPTEWYENEGFKGGVAYPCGAVVKDGQLFVYYGGADTVICAATAPLDEFLKHLKESLKEKGLKHKPLLHKINYKKQDDPIHHQYLYAV